MNSPWDADDMMKRSLISSIMSFRKRNRETPAPPCQPPFSVPPVRGPDEPGPSREVMRAPVFDVPAFDLLDERTQQDIYQEIVCECEFLEQKPPLGCCDHHMHAHPRMPPAPPQPQPHPGAGHSPIPPAFSPMSALQHQMQAATVRSPISSPCPLSPTSPLSGVASPLLPPPVTATLAGVPAPASTPLLVLPTDNKVIFILKNKTSTKQISGVSLEEFVKLVVSAVREAGIGQKTPVEKPTKPIADASPEEVLRRKRQQNNEAAARYRKRQREAKEAAHAELDGLQSRNKELKRTVADMETEIEKLKEAVLGQRPDA